MNMHVADGNTKYSSWEFFLLSAAEKISLSESQYQTIKNRYEQLQKVLDGAEDPLLADAHIFVQGSMRLRTTIKPVPGAPKDLGTIDADAIVWLPHAQGASALEVLDAIYKRFDDGSRVQAKIELLRRGVRIVYADEDPGFHIDVTPARAIASNEQYSGAGKLEVPDRELRGWKASSPLPYAAWLQNVSQEQIAIDSSHRLAKRDGRLVEASQEPLPDYVLYAEQDPLRAAVKILKRHRDEWAIRTGNEGHRPISAVITTLASQAYLDVARASKARALRPLEAMMLIVRGMPAHIQGHPGYYQVCNPEDPGENFAEKWNRLDGQLYRQAFDRWHAQAVSAFELGLQTFTSTAAFSDSVNESFGVGGAFVDEINNAIPPNWTLPGRADTVTRNAMMVGSFFGEGAQRQDSQEGVKPVGRLG